MSYLFLGILSIPEVMLLFRHTERTEIVLQFVVSVGILIIGLKIFKFSGYTRIIGLVLIALGAVSYYYFVIEPLIKGNIVSLGIF